MKRNVNTLPDYYTIVSSDKTKRYVELALFADHSMYEKYNKDEETIHKRLEDIALFVNRFYDPLGITITLVYTEVWKNGDPFQVSTDPDQTLSSFLDYRKGQIKGHPHDNAHLITNIKFAGIVGKAYKGTMCSFDYSGGVDVDHSTDIRAVAATLAHEMGHNFGMEHDVDYDTCKCPLVSCVMAPALSPQLPMLWSDCSITYLHKSLKRGVDYCLRNPPKTFFTGSTCGNGVVEPGEDCDCGGIGASLCGNKCCDPKTCKLAAGAICATGDCCDLNTCRPFAKATVCRRATNMCDLEEFCDGDNNHCPGDFYVQDGLPCPDEPDDFCYNGKCGSRTNQCRYLWGESAASLHDECYQQNVRGSFYGNCGYNPVSQVYPACKQEDAICGRLHCQNSKERPEFGDPSTVYSGYSKVLGVSGDEIACRVVRTTFTGDEPDPGLVPDGAKCGADKMCVESKCVNRSAIMERVQKCKPSNCNGLGICNNVGNCHCEYGYGGEACAIPGYGGSINSGPASDKEAFNAFMAMFWLVLVVSLAFIIVSIVLKKKKNIWLPGKMWKGLRRHLNLQSLVRVPVRKAPPPPTTKRQRFNDLNAAWNDPPVANVPHASAIPGTYCPPMSSPSGSSSNTSTSEMLGKIAQLTHENKRPDNPPPVPPHKMLSGRDEKPPLPMKPPVVKSVGPNSSDSVAKVSVRELAAKFSSAANV
ncbi:hypothetical protein QR680_001735 [Steinernema hermaphroditum]|uniref:EGF-like domain-containing protein n=1 Tax=Steinernema hermaphroditum TaxID=289476 RepID=A0AA39GZR6_9BILA|nr:hypothetical protein QR680_001735 [Steinernema hermaphroditum]